jgi:hypothetical protein
VSGSVERPPLATDTKADLDLAFTAESEDVTQLAVTVSNVPDKLFAVETALRGFLQSEAAYALRVALDAYVINAIQASAPPTGSTGATLVEKIRHAVGAARDLGASPSVVGVSPTISIDLDLSASGPSGLDYLFPASGIRAARARSGASRSARLEFEAFCKVRDVSGL